MMFISSYKNHNLQIMSLTVILKINAIFNVFYSKHFGFIHFDRELVIRLKKF